MAKRITKSQVPAKLPENEELEGVLEIVDEALDDGYMDVMADKTVVIFAVGGTIAMKSDEKGAVVPAVTGEDLSNSVPGLSDLCSIEVVDFANLPSGSVTPDLMLKLSREIQKTLKRPEVSGVVVTHGTDTLEETAYFLSISLAEEFLSEPIKPIVVTGAMRTPDSVGADGPANLLASVRVACNDIEDPIPRVLVCLNNEIHSPARVMKTHSANCDTFQSPWWGPIGYVDEDRVYFRGVAELGDSILCFPTPKKLTAKVPVVKAMTGDKGEILDMVVDSGADGVVIEGFGRGNLPAAMMPSIKKAIKKGVTVVLATRTAGGRVLDAYGYKGSVTDVLSIGGIMAGETTSAKARLLLMYLLSQDRVQDLLAEDPERCRAYLQEAFDPVLADRLFR